jgi:hypothetical protein
MIRDRASFKDLSILLAVLLAGLYLTFEYDLFNTRMA